MSRSILFKDHLLQLVRSGAKTQTSRLPLQIIPCTAEMVQCRDLQKDSHTLKEYVFSVVSDYTLTVRTRYYPGEVIPVSEAWKCIRKDDTHRNMDIEFRDGQVVHIYFPSEARYIKFQKYFGKSGWQSPYFLPKEAVRLYLQVEQSSIRRLSSLTIPEIYAEGCPKTEKGIDARVWMDTTWDICAPAKIIESSISDVTSFNNPWIEPITFQKFYDKAQEAAK